MFLTEHLMSIRNSCKEMPKKYSKIQNSNIYHMFGLLSIMFSAPYPDTFRYRLNGIGAQTGKMEKKKCVIDQQNRRFAELSTPD